MKYLKINPDNNFMVQTNNYTLIFVLKIRNIYIFNKTKDFRVLVILEFHINHAIAKIFLLLHNKLVKNNYNHFL